VIGEALVRVRRGAGVESEHRVAWATTDRGRGGRARGAGGVASAPYPGPTVYARSAAKPFQALAGVRAGVPERFELSTEHLAMACASHGGSETHVARVREMLEAAGWSEDQLECGAAEPRDPAAAIALREAGEQPRRVHHNCSGKHAFGLAFAAAEGWPPEGYIDKGHPLQDAMEGGIAEATGVRPGELTRATDGCGMRTFSVPIARLAAAFGRLASGDLGPAGERLTAAMTSHPELVAFDGALDTELMRARPGLVSKIGAEGVLGIGLPDGRGAALKVLDGATRALDAVAPLLLEQHWEVEVDSPAVDRLREGPVFNSRGERVGGAEATLAA
jgi:L-asparaginase II